jgi:hypothetical protein
MSPVILRSLSATAVALIVATSTAVADPQYPCGKNPSGNGSCCLDNPLARGCSVRSVPKTNAQGPSTGPSSGTKPTLGGTAPINPGRQ